MQCDRTGIDNAFVLKDGDFDLQLSFHGFTEIGAAIVKTLISKIGSQIELGTTDGGQLVH